MRIMQNNSSLDANIKLLNFTEKMKLASGKRRITTATTLFNIYIFVLITEMHSPHIA